MIPIGFHAFAIWERVNAYGITEQRYTLILSVLWFAFLAFGNLKKRLPIRLIPLSLAVLFILSSFGPWGGIAVSTNSQYHQLMKVLNKNNLLVNGKPVKAEADISYEDRVSISSIVQYLCRKDKAHVIEPLFNPDKKEDWSCSSYNITEDVFGFKYVYPRRSSLFGDGSFQNDPQESFYWNSTYSNYTDVKGYDLVINNLSVYSHYTVNTPPKVWEKSYDLPDKKTLLLVYEPVEHILKFKLDNMDEVAVDVKTFLKTNNIQGSNTGDLDLVFESETLKYKMIFRNVNGDINSDDLFVKNIGFTLLIGEKN
ncbi:MAG: DUF4153 domain-containing protein [Alphaproteobacteria bacterium]|nr:DUF4153 domain-containing protein [Alphaproteobacteria bacterium]